MSVHMGMCISVCVYGYVCLCVHIGLCVSVFANGHMHKCVCLWAWACVCVLSSKIIPCEHLSLGEGWLRGC